MRPTRRASRKSATSWASTRFSTGSWPPARILLIEGCASGGRRIDLETIKRSHTFWKSDNTGDIPSMRFHDTGGNTFLPGVLLNTNVLPVSGSEVAFDIASIFGGPLRLMALARKTGRPAHILHVSTAEELEYLKDFRDVATVEVLVNHLTQVAPDCYDTLKGFGVMNPPIRDERHREASWAAIRNGTVDTIGSDHAPHSRAAKEKPWPDCPAGLTGVQTLVPIMLDHVNAGRLSLSHLTDLMAAGPARVYGIVGKGRLAAGYDADFTIVDMKRRRTIEDSWIASPCGWTPFAGKSVLGWPVATIVRGKPIMREDEVLGTPAGRLARFQK